MDSSVQDSAQPSRLTPRQVTMAVGGVMVGMLLSALDQTVVSTALPRIVSEIGGLDRLPWVVTIYLVTSMATAPLWGKISDLYGRRPVLQAAITTFVVGSVLCGAAQETWQLILFRAIQGVGAGGLFVLALAVIADVVPRRSAAGTRARSAPCSAWPAWADRSSAGGSPTGPAGGGCS